MRRPHERPHPRIARRHEGVGRPVARHVSSLERCPAPAPPPRPDARTPDRARAARVPVPVASAATGARPRVPAPGAPRGSWARDLPPPLSSASIRSRRSTTRLAASMEQKLNGGDAHSCNEMRQLLALFVTALALGAPANALAAPGSTPGSPSLIVIGASIGPIHLGMARSDVIHLFGTPTAPRVSSSQAAGSEREALSTRSARRRLPHHVRERHRRRHLHRGAVLPHGLGGRPRLPLPSGGVTGVSFQPVPGGIQPAVGRHPDALRLPTPGPIVISHAEVYRSAYFDC